MAKLTTAQLERKALIDSVRAVVALKLKIRKREILNEIENEVLGEFDKRLADGKSFRLDLRSIVEEAGKCLDA